MEYGGIKVLGAVRDKSGENWLVRLGVRFTATGEPEFEVPVAARDKQGKDMSIGEAADMAVLGLLTDMLITVRSNAERFDEDVRNRLITGFPRTE